MEIFLSYKRWLRNYWCTEFSFKDNYSLKQIEAQKVDVCSIFKMYIKMLHSQEKWLKDMENSVVIAGGKEV